MRAGVCLFLTIGLASQAAALDPRRATTQYVIKTWQRDNGLPYSAITSLAQTDSYLWLGTNAGLTRFDGAVFTKAGAGPLEVGVAALAPAEDGTVWIATQSGQVGQLKEGWLTLSEGPDRNYSITSLLPARSGALWVGTLGAGVYRHFQERYEQYRPAGFTEILTMIEDASGVLWMGGRGTGLLKMSGGHWTRYAAAAGLPSDTIHALHQDRAGDLWIGTASGLCRLRGGRFASFTGVPGAPQGAVTALTSDSNGNLWVGTLAEGLKRFSRGRFASLAQRDGLADDAVRTVLEDDERNLWVGTSNGLNRLSEGRFLTYGRPEGLKDPTVQAIAEGRRGDLWIGTGGAGVYRLHGDALSALGVLPKANVIAIYEAADGSLWLSTDDRRLFRVRAGAVSEMTPRMPSGARPRISVIGEREGQMLFAASGFGLGRIRQRRFEKLHPQAPLIRSVFTLYTDPQGTLWLGSSEGLVRVRDGRYTFYTTRDGLPDDRVRSISAEEDGTLWLATMGGLCRFHDGQIRALTTQDGLPDALLGLVLDDRQDNLWLSSVGHLFRVSKPGILDVLAGKARRVTAFELDTADGLRSTEVPLSAYPGFRARDGRLWFATGRGASVIDPAQRTPRSAPPPLRLERVIVDGDEDLQDSYPPGKGTLEIHYTALSYSAPERLRFRHKLSGLDEAWTYAGDSRVARYTNLRPHRYTFMLDVADSDGVWSGSPLELTFTIEPHWYQTPLFFWVVVALLASAVWGAYLLRMLAMRRRFAAVLDERNRLAREMHDTLAQNLGGVAFQLEAVKMQYGNVPPPLRERLDEISKMVRYAVAEAYRAIRDLRSQVLQTRDLAAAISETAQRAAADANIELNIDVNGGAPPLTASVENNLLRIVQEAITNTVAHAGAQHLEVGLQFSRELLSLRVRDDGCGFDGQNAVAPGSGHYGLMGMRERANRIGARLTFTSQPGAGTEVLVELPITPSLHKDRSEP